MSEEVMPTILFMVGSVIGCCCVTYKAGQLCLRYCGGGAKPPPYQGGYPPPTYVHTPPPVMYHQTTPHMMPYYPHDGEQPQHYQQPEYYHPRTPTFYQTHDPSSPGDPRFARPHPHYSATRRSPSPTPSLRRDPELTTHAGEEERPSLLPKRNCEGFIYGVPLKKAPPSEAGL